MKNRKEIEAEAVGWVIRLREAGEADWDAFTLWLEADPEHLAAYEEAALVDGEAEGLTPGPAPIPAIEEERVVALPARAPRRHFLGWAAAASILLTGTYVVLGSGGAPYAVETAAGERRVIALDDGSRIALNGGTRVTLDPDRPRYARLETGEALFEVVHDESRTFEVEAGGALLRDMGTVFNVLAERERLEVAVSEGAILFNPAREAATLTPGMALRRTAGQPARVERVGADAVGGWRQGRLAYSAASVGEVAGDLTRNLGVRVAADRSVASLPFSGVIGLDGSREQVLARSAALLGLSLKRAGDGWLLTRASAPR